VLAAHGNKDSGMLTEVSRVFVDLWEEMDSHMHKEEVVLIPCIERLEAAAAGGGPLPPLPFGTIGNPISVMEREHDSAGHALHQLREMTSDYLLPEYACATYRALFDGFRALEADLHQHIHLENNILFPRAAGLEKSRD
jgi:regulator of cell morphogenesis and NO signaling